MDILFIKVFAFIIIFILFAFILLGICLIITDFIFELIDKIRYFKNK